MEKNVITNPFEWGFHTEVGYISTPDQRNATWMDVKENNGKVDAIASFFSNETLHTTSLASVCGIECPEDC